MNIQQVKKDLDNDIIVSRATHVKVAEAALLMEETLRYILANSSAVDNASLASETLQQVLRL